MLFGWYELTLTGVSAVAVLRARVQLTQLVLSDSRGREYMHIEPRPSISAPDFA